jgi:hypothetical protein
MDHEADIRSSGEVRSRRRRFLHAIGVAGAVGVAGCTGPIGGGSDDTTTDDPGTDGDGDEDQPDTDGESGEEGNGGDDDGKSEEEKDGEDDVLDGREPERGETGPRLKPIDNRTVADVWAGHPVGFDLLVHENKQFVAYYNDDRQMCVAQRDVGAEEFEVVELPEAVGWDSHNYITITADEEGYLHLSGNMHGDPLVYFRTTDPLDATTFERVESMVGNREGSATYPRFFESSVGLVFEYRDGGSGDGDWIYNRYDVETRTWSRLFDQPLLDGQGDVNAYMIGPVLGPDDRFHLLWMWRETPDAQTNKNISYARSPNLIDWETAGGRPLDVPITPETEGVVIDFVPPYSGLLNSKFALGFDAIGRPIASYHRYDSIPEDPEAYQEEADNDGPAEEPLLPGDSQIYNARFEDGAWQVHQATDWDYRWEFGGRGSLGADEVELGQVDVDGQGRLTQYISYPEESGTYVLEEDTLSPVEKLPDRPTVPEDLTDVHHIDPNGDWEGVPQTNWSDATGGSCQDAIAYRLRWETLDQNRDQPRSTWPDPTPLQLYTMIDADAVEIAVDLPDAVSIAEDETVTVEVRDDVAIDTTTLEFGAPEAVYACNGAIVSGVDGRSLEFPISQTGFEESTDEAILLGEAPNGVPVYATASIEVT